MSAISNHLLPDNSVIDAQGVMSIGGCSLVEVAKQFGTPVFVYDEDHMRARCHEAVKAFGPNRVIYATKAFFCTAMAKLAYDEGLMLDVATGGELFVALNAGVPGSSCVMHGNNKSMDELRMAIKADVHHIVVDNFDELDRLDALHAEGLPVPRVQLRITPGVSVHTHEYIATGQNDSKFGFNLGNGDAHKAAERARRSNSVDFVGVHCHIGSNVFAVENFAHAAKIMVDLANELEVEQLTFGGGLGVAYVETEHASTITEWSTHLLSAAEHLRKPTQVFVEPGRSIVAAAAVTVYEVGTVKPIPGVRTYVAVDGGMSDNPRPVMYGSGYELFMPTKANADRTESIRLVGKHCESGDILISETLAPAGLRVGDLIATPVTGAYGHSMGSNYNKITRPPVVFARNGNARLVVRRETYEDLVRLDVSE